MGGGGGGGGGEGGGRKSEGSTVDSAPAKKTEETVPDRRPEQKGGAPRAIAQRLACTAQMLFQLPCWAESQGLCPLHCC